MWKQPKCSSTNEWIKNMWAYIYIYTHTYMLCAQLLSHVLLFATLCTVARGILQARILEWVVISFSKGSFWPRDWIPVSCVSCITGRFFIHWAIGKVPIHTHTHNGILLRHKKKNEILPFATIRMDLECIILSEISKRQILYDLIYMWNLKIKQTNAYTKNKDSDIQNKLPVGEKEKGKGKIGVRD